MATCGSERPGWPDQRCILPPEHLDDHADGYGALAHTWENRADGVSYLNVSDVPIGRQAQLAELNRMAGNSTQPRHARIPDPPPHVLARRTDPGTSQSAAVDINGVRVTHRSRILTVIRASGSEGLDQEQVAKHAGLTQAQSWRRISDLHNDGLIEVKRDARGSEVTHLLSSGREGQVYVAVAV